MQALFKKQNQTNIDRFDNLNFRKSKDDFHWVDTELFHQSRRKKILKKYPEIMDLYGTEILTFPISVAICLSQILLSFWVSDRSTLTFYITAYVVGGTLSHWIQTACHELSHNLCFRKPWANKCLAIFTNFPTAVPSAISFQRYHSEHHTFQSVDTLDHDIPSLPEIRIFRTTLFKFFWVFLLPLFYAFRPVIMRPKKVGKWEIINAASVFLFDWLFIRYVGGRALWFLLCSTFLGMGLHPAAGNFIAEHFEFVLDSETYSYYGPMNIVNFNVGYHNEHHDFPRVPWSKLPEVHRIASEFYKDMPCYSSYMKVFYYYITSSEMGPFSRIKRPLENHVIRKNK